MNENGRIVLPAQYYIEVFRTPQFRKHGFSPDAPAQTI
jgi:hypothetical protein